MWEVLALRYAHHDRTASANFVMPVEDAHDAMPMDYFVWLLRGPGGREVLVDTGFDAATAAKRGRRILRPVEECLRAVGTEPGAIRDVVVTHLHYDHAGNLGLFPNATFHIQDREVAFATGRHMCSHCLRHAFEVEDVVRLVRAVYAERVQFHGEVQGGEGRGRAGRHAAPCGRAHGRVADGARGDRARAARHRRGRQPLLRQHGTGEPLPDHLRPRRHGAGLAAGQAAGRR
jgi:hypothetical protein